MDNRARHFQFVQILWDITNSMLKWKGKVATEGIDLVS
jgi:hypothetical protein